MRPDHPRKSVSELVANAVSSGQTWAQTQLSERTTILNAVADALDDASEGLVRLGQRETHLAEPRLRGELKRTTFQLRFLAESARTGSPLDLRVDHADSDWPMGVPRPDLRRSAVPLGPVLVFGASNFPFAFSVAGGDTAAALSAGCAVIFKVHEGHPELSRATAEIVISALAAAGAPSGLFATVHDPTDARAVLTHPDVKAAAFTGSIPAGRALYDLAQARPEPIPFYGELGSVNPVFVTAEAAANRPDEIVDGFVQSFTMGAGQFCTKPGVLIVPEASDLVDLLARAHLPGPVPLLNGRIARGYRRAVDELGGRPHVKLLASDAASSSEPPHPTLLLSTVADVLCDLDASLTECFGPAALVVTYRRESEMQQFAEAMDGQLTATVIAEPTDAVIPELIQTLARKAGRLVWNQWPTGVSVTHAQQHGGPYPASTAPSTTSVGTASISRFLRPVAWQGFPDQLLPIELREASTLDVPRQVDGTVVAGGDKAYSEGDRSRPAR